MLPRVKMKPARSARLRSSSKNQLSDTHLLTTYLVAPNTSHSPVAPPGWPHRSNAPIYDALVHTYNKEHVFRKKLTNLRDVKRYLNIATIAKDGLLCAWMIMSCLSDHELPEWSWACLSDHELPEWSWALPEWSWAHWMCSQANNVKFNPRIITCYFAKS